MKKQENVKASAFSEAGEAWIGAFRALAEQGVRSVSEAVEALAKEAGLAVEAVTAAAGAKTPLEASKAAGDYFSAFAERAADNVRVAAEATPKRFAEAAAPFEAAASKAYSAFQAR